MKFNGLAAVLRQDIVGGKLLPGTRLPTRTDLARQYCTTKVTIQRAMDLLVADGLVTARVGDGTFVAERNEALGLPAALVLAGRQPVGRSRFLEALTWEAERLQRSGKNLITYSIEAGDGRAALDELTKRVLDHKVAGLIFTLDTFAFRGTPLLDEPHIPRVRIGCEQCGVVGLEVDQSSRAFTMYEPVLEAFARRGHRRIALLRNAQYPGELAEDPFVALAARFGLDVKPWWVQGVPAFEVPDHAERIAQLLMQGDAAHRPDALFIADDNLVPHATRGLLGAGLRVPEDVEVVAHANFPWPTDCHVPARRIGSDIGRVLVRALDGIEALRGGRPLERQALPVQWDDETNDVGRSKQADRPQRAKGGMV